MSHAIPDANCPKVLIQAPAELTQGRLLRLGEGIGKVVYASTHWVVKRERSPSEVVALIVIWRLLRKLERLLPFRWGVSLLERPSQQLRLLRVMMQATMAILPRTLWFTTHVRQVWKQYHFLSARGDRLARQHLHGTSLIPEDVTFPATVVKVGGWPGSLVVSKATERVETTLHQKLTDLSKRGRFEELEGWLDNLLSTRQSGWSKGLFSLDAHLKNFGIIEGRIVLLDTGGLTNQWKDIEKRLAFEESVTEPHIALGLGPALERRPDIASRFNQRWKTMLNRKFVREIWGGE